MGHFIAWSIIGVMAIILSSMGGKCSWVAYFACYIMLMSELAKNVFS